MEPALERWLRARNVRAGSQTPLVGDLSQRRYLRFEKVEGGTVVVAVYPATLVGVCDRFAHTSGLLQGLGIRVPRILDQACAHGWMLLEDLGPHTLYDLPETGWSRLEPLFSVAVTVAERISGLPVELIGSLNPPLDEDLLRRELRQTREAFLEPQGLLGKAAEADRIDRALDQLCARLGAGSLVPCHRDLMARNLIACEPEALDRRTAATEPRDPAALESLAVLDHQDLRLGPPAYDVASLLNDSLFPPAETERRLLEKAFPSGPYLAYHRAAAQRTLKAVGSYAVFERRGSDRHRPLIAPTLGRALHHLGELPEMAPLVPLLDRLWSGAVT